MVCLWFVDGTHMVCFQCDYSLLTVHLRYAYGMITICLWHAYGLLMVHLRYVYSVLTVHLQFAYGIPTVCLRYTYGILRYIFLTCRDVLDKGGHPMRDSSNESSRSSR